MDNQKNKYVDAPAFVMSPIHIKACVELQQIFRIPSDYHTWRQRCQSLARRRIVLPPRTKVEKRHPHYQRHNNVQIRNMVKDGREYIASPLMLLRLSKPL
jgi:hypothetical protein